MWFAEHAGSSREEHRDSPHVTRPVRYPKGLQADLEKELLVQILVCAVRLLASRSETTDFDGDAMP